MRIISLAKGLSIISWRSWPNFDLRVRGGVWDDSQGDPYRNDRCWRNALTHYLATPPLGLHHSLLRASSDYDREFHAVRTRHIASLQYVDATEHVLHVCNGRMPYSAHFYGHHGIRYNFWNLAICLRNRSWHYNFHVFDCLGLHHLHSLPHQLLAADLYSYYSW